MHQNDNRWTNTFLLVIVVDLNIFLLFCIDFRFTIVKCGVSEWMNEEMIDVICDVRQTRAKETGKTLNDVEDEIVDCWTLTQTNRSTHAVFKYLESVWDIIYL